MAKLIFFAEYVNHGNLPLVRNRFTFCGPRAKQICGPPFVNTSRFCLEFSSFLSLVLLETNNVTLPLTCICNHVCNGMYPIHSAVMPHARKDCSAEILCTLQTMVSVRGFVCLPFTAAASCAVFEKLHVQAKLSIHF